jgi:hypothetical protein
MKKTIKLFGITTLAVVMAFSFATLSLTSCDDGGGTHTHTWGAWQSNATQHWKECDCGEEYGRDNHIGTPTCSVCGYASGSPNLSLDGVWDWIDIGRQITISGSTGVFSKFENNPSAFIQDAINKGYFAIGGQAWRNIKSTGNLTWSGQFLAITVNTSNPNVAIGTTWVNCTFTLSADGQTLNAINSNGGTSTWTRGNYKLDGVWDWIDIGRQITISGSTGVFSRFENNPSAFIQDAINKGYFAIGGQAWRNIKSTGNLTWSGQFLAITVNTSNPNVATGTNWVNCTFTLSADGQTLTAINSNGGTSTWIRKQ